MFNSIYAEELKEYYAFRSSTLSISATKHELCYLKRFDSYLCNQNLLEGYLSEKIINEWVNTLNGKSSSVENEIVVVRQFLKYLQLSGASVYLPVTPKVHDDYIPYFFTDEELDVIFNAADNGLRKFTFGINGLEFTRRSSDKVLGTELQFHYTPNSLFLQDFVALLGRLRLSPLGCPFRQKGQSCQGCFAPNSALSLTGTVFLPFL